MSNDDKILEKEDLGKNNNNEVEDKISNPETSKKTIEENISVNNKENNLNINNNEKEKENNPNPTTDIFLISKNDSYLGRKTLWSQDIDLELELIEYKRRIYTNSSTKRTRWGYDNEKIFTPPAVTKIPKGLDVNVFENLLRTKKLYEIEKKISTGNYIDEEIDNDKDLRPPSPEPEYDKKNGQRINTRENRNKERFLKQKDLLINDLILYDKNYQPPTGYKPPKIKKKIYIKNNNQFGFTKFILGPKGENIKKLGEMSGCKISVRGQGGGWKNLNLRGGRNKNGNTGEDDELHVLIEGDNNEEVEKGISLVMPYLDENGEKYKEAKNAMTVYAINNSEFICEVCGEKGHKSWYCPIIIGQHKAEVRCKYCGDKGHPSADCPLLKEGGASIKYSNEILLNEEENNNKKAVANDIQNSIIFTGNLNKIGEINKNLNEVGNENNNAGIIIGQNIEERTFGTYEENLVNRYAKMLAINASKNKMMKDHGGSLYNNLSGAGVIEGGPVGYNLDYSGFGGLNGNYGFNFNNQGKGIYSGQYTNINKLNVFSNLYTGYPNDSEKKNVNSSINENEKK